MKAIVLLLASMSAFADVTCVQMNTITSCSNGFDAYRFGPVTEYNSPGQGSMTVWNTNINRYQSVPQVQQPIIAPLNASSSVFKPIN